MNFFGHAAVAAWHDDRPGFVLGAMLPDFQGMLRLRPPARLDAAVELGVRLHHATDAAFHGIPVVVRLMATARSALLAAGVTPGPARAVAHIGTEILLDEALATDARAVAAYLGALGLGATDAAPVAWSPPDSSRRFQSLLVALMERGVTAEPSSPELVASRLRRTLAPRPRLALREREETQVRDWVVAARPGVVGCAVEIVSELRARLSAAGFGLSPSEPSASARPG